MPAEGHRRGSLNGYVDYICVHADDTNYPVSFTTCLYEARPDQGPATVLGCVNSLPGYTTWCSPPFSAGINNAGNVYFTETTVFVPNPNEAIWTIELLY